MSGAAGLFELARPRTLALAIQALPALAKSPRAPAFGLLGAGASVVPLAVVGAVIPNPFVVRMTSVRGLDYLVLVVSVLLLGVLAATLALPISDQGTTSGMAGGALTYLEPVQPLLAASGIALPVLGITVRLAGTAECRRQDSALST